MEILWRIIFIVLMGSLAWLLHSQIGDYPPPLERSAKRGRELLEALLLWIIAVIFSALRLLWLTPWLNRIAPNRTIFELTQVPLVSLVYIGLPLLILSRSGRWTARKLGLTLEVRSSSVTVFALVFGLATGVIGFLTDQTVIGIEPLPAGALLLLLYNNDFVEEFYHRGVIQSKLEQALGQRKAIFLGGILFGLTHVVFDIYMLKESGALFVFFAAALQTIAGWILGIIYMKTRSLWPGTICHYLGNWLPAILASLLVT